MKIIFYIGPPEIQDTLIRVFTNSNISHCELVFSNNLAFSAVPKQGTRFTEFRNLEDRKIWITLELSWITEEQEKRIYKFCKQEKHCKYDWSAVLLGRINPLHNHRSKWFCSEICAAAIRPFTKGLNDLWYTPKTLHNSLKDSMVFNI